MAGCIMEDAYQPETHSKEQKQHNVSNCVKHIHAACEHIYGYTTSEPIELHPAIHYQSYNAVPTIVLLHPRWCLTCQEKRANAIHESFEARLTGSEFEDREDEEVVKQRAFVRGVRDGRIFALTRYLEEGEHLENGRIEEDGRLELVGMMENCGLGSVHDEDSNLITDDLLEKFKDQTLSDEEELQNEMVRDIEKWFAKEDEYRKGTIEGRAMQATMERFALMQGDPTMRIYLFEQALL